MYLVTTTPIYRRPDMTSVILKKTFKITTYLGSHIIASMGLAASRGFGFKNMKVNVKK